MQFATGKSYDVFLTDRGLQHIVLHCITIIGEAAGRIEAEVQYLHPEVPWRPIIAMRNRLVHGYFDVQLDVVWNTVEVDIPEIIRQVELLLNSE